MFISHIGSSSGILAAPILSEQVSDQPVLFHVVCDFSWVMSHFYYFMYVWFFVRFGTWLKKTSLNIGSRISSESLATSISCMCACCWRCLPLHTFLYCLHVFLACLQLPFSMAVRASMYSFFMYVCFRVLLYDRTKNWWAASASICVYVRRYVCTCVDMCVRAWSLLSLHLCCIKFTYIYTHISRTQMIR